MSCHDETQREGWNYGVQSVPTGKSLPILDWTANFSPAAQPIPLDLLTLVSFTDPPASRGGRLLPFGGGGKKEADAQFQYTNSGIKDGRAVFPCTIQHSGRLGGLYTLFAESSQARLEWKAKLEEAIGMRKVTQESNKAFEVVDLSVDTFCVPTLLANTGPSQGNGGNFTGKVTCSVSFGMPCRVSALFFPR